MDKTFVSSFNIIHSTHYSLNNKHLICNVSRKSQIVMKVRPQASVLEAPL